VLLPLARIHQDGTVDLFPDGPGELLCLPSARRPARTGSRRGRAGPVTAGSPPPGRRCSGPTSASG